MISYCVPSISEGISWHLREGDKKKLSPAPEGDRLKYHLLVNQWKCSFSMQIYIKYNKVKYYYSVSFKRGHLFSAEGMAL
jgi:hypothetical protein